MDAVDAARLQTITASLSQSSNDNDYIGVHNANLLFSSRHSITLSGREIAMLVETGLVHYSNHTVPFF